MKSAPTSGQRAPRSGPDHIARLERELADLRERLWLERADFEVAQQALVEDQRNLERSRERYLELYDLAPIGYALLDRNCFIRAANLTLAGMLNVPRDRLVNTLLTRYVVPEDRRRVLQHLRRCRRSAGGEVITTEVVRPLRDGGQVVLALTSRTRPALQPLHEEGFHTAVLDVSARRQAEAALRTLNQQLEERVTERTRNLRSLANAILLVEERERFRLANDIHDGLTQLLVAAGLRLGTAMRANMPRDERESLTEARRLLEEALQAARTLTFALSPPVLRELGLLAAAKWLSHDIHSRFGVAVAVEGGESLGELPDAVKLLAYRCLRELLVNVGKHASARHARVTLARVDDTIQVEVTDDGRGFAPRPAPKELPALPARRGFGLFSIRERLEHLGGSMEVKATPGKGTRVKLAVPVSAIDKEGVPA